MKQYQKKAHTLYGLEGLLTFHLVI